jgi:hypothetical protein
VQLKIVDANTYAAWCEEMAKKSKKAANKKQAKKGNARRKKQQQPKKRDYRRGKAYTLSTNSENDRELEESIDLSIRRESDVTSEGGDNDNGVEGQISEAVQVSVQSTRPARCQNSRCMGVDLLLYYSH